MPVAYDPSPQILLAARHMPGKHDQSTHAGKKKMASEHVSAKKFEDERGGVAGTKQLSTDKNSSHVELVTFGDGSVAVLKRSKGSPDEAKAEFDAEELGAHVGKRLGLDPPVVHRTGDDEAYFDHVDKGKVAAATGTKPAHLPESLDGRRIGLLDAITENGDRNSGNWFIHGKSSLTPIDHGASWEPAHIPGGRIKDPQHADYLGGFTGHYMSGGAWRDNDLSPTYMKKLRGQLEDLKPNFEELGRTDWYNRMMTRFDIIAGHAKGSISL